MQERWPLAVAAEISRVGVNVRHFGVIMWSIVELSRVRKKYKEAKVNTIRTL
jgi:hypothetical protein